VVAIVMIGGLPIVKSQILTILWHYCADYYVYSIVMGQWVTAITSVTTIRTITVLQWWATRLSWLMSRITSQSKIVAISRYAILIKYNTLIWHWRVAISL